MTIEDFIAARLDEDERIALEANGGRPWHAIDLAEEGIGIYDGEDDGNPDAGYRYSPPRTSETRHITRHDPARALRQVEHGRKALARHRQRDAGAVAALGAVAETCVACGVQTGRRPWPCVELLDLAAIWSDHPDYQPEWNTPDQA